MKRVLPPLLLGLLLTLTACKPARDPAPALTPSHSATQTVPPTAPPEPTPTEVQASAPVWGSQISECSQADPDDGSILLVTGRFALPHIENAGGVPAYAAINRYYEELAKGLKSDALADVSLALDDFRTAQALGDPFTAFSSEETYKVVHETDDTAVILRTHYGHYGGPYPSLLYMADAFDLSTGRVLAFSDFFSDAGRAEEIIRAEILRQGGAHPEYDQSALASAFQKENFYPAEDGFVFYYQPGTLSPNAAGLSSFIVPYDLLDGLLSR